MLQGFCKILLANRNILSCHRGLQLLYPARIACGRAHLGMEPLSSNRQLRLKSSLAVAKCA